MMVYLRTTQCVGHIEYVKYSVKEGDRGLSGGQNSCMLLASEHCCEDLSGESTFAKLNRPSHSMFPLG